MTPNEIFKRFKFKYNGNDTNEGIDLLPGVFVLMFNTIALKWEIEKLQDDSIRLDDLEPLLVTEFEIDKFKKFDNSIEAELPTDFIREASSYVLADRGKCKNKKVYTFEKKALGFNSIIADDYNGPQFDYEETPFIITKNKMKIYFDDFKIRKIVLNYYKKPDKLDLAGYTKEDGSASVEQSTNLTDDNIDEILNRLVREVSGNNSDAEKVQFAQNKITLEP